MASLEITLRVLDERAQGESPVEFGLAILGTTLEQRQAAITLLEVAARKIREDTMKKFGTGEIIPEPEDIPQKPEDDESEDEAPEED